MELFMDKMRVLILCTGNSCRSQFAEAIINHDMGDRWDAFSAGTNPAGYVHPFAIKTLLEIGIEHHGVSKSVDQFRNEPFDLVITVCDDAAENCPVWLGKGKRAHIGFSDPAKAEGSEDEIISAFRAVRDYIRVKTLAYLEEFQKQSVSTH
jgi:arsenate reductase (thioredoxin)